MATSNSYIFSTLTKFSDGNGKDLATFLKQFDRCCAVANKVDGDVPVKRQLLMLFVEGRARAALEEYEISQNGAQQTYAVLIGKLKEYFDSTAARETSMSLFDRRTKKITETEEEFMLDLLNLYTTANPDHAAAVALLSIKRKFLAGISPTLRSKIFVFCDDPYAAAVTRENLLAHCRRAQNLLSFEQPEIQSSNYSTDRVLVSSDDINYNYAGRGDDPLLVSAIHNLSTRLDEYERNNDRRFGNFEETIAAIGGGQQQNYRGRGGRGYNYNRGSFQNNANRGGGFQNNASGSSNPHNNHNNNNAGNYRGGFRGGFRGGSRGGGSRGGYISCSVIYDVTK